ncbi:MAG TPA: hypothetical protein PLM53_00600 [Spirochaetota bacterium]|nr:hypothetical protein [Spirochaetota bacterium]HQF06814.1 hypothetical protein [Spirochaetota bacterium]HQH95567.1 hypothetical protein [Spirochaetota bacterium]HQJ69145.1 hypothetical protein [Spirochaetota bacterium]HRS75891.1 hypothetical protein [Spirochaetota bacterium]
MKSISSIYLQIARVIVLIVAFDTAVVSGESEPYDRIVRDNTIIGPGLGSDGVLLNEDIEAVLKRFGRTKFKVSKPRHPEELFANVFKTNSTKKIYFDALYHHEDNKFTACVFQGTVMAIIGFDNGHVTTDSVNLRSGINSFIYYYGNRNLTLLKADSNGIYLYSALGIAVADDGMNDSIDLYLVFAVENSGRK